MFPHNVGFLMLKGLKLENLPEEEAPKYTTISLA
jgi:hypothetical protein